jgi:hypothetical protein
MGHGNCNGFALNVYDSGHLVYHTGQANRLEFAAYYYD